MRKLALAAALATTALASPAFARDDAWYIGAHGGGMIVEDIDTVVAGNAGSGSNWDLNTGYDVDGVIGYDFGMFRLEAEVGFRRAWTDVNAYVNGQNSTKGNGRSLNFMLNGMLDFGPDDGLQGFVGGGAGVGRTYLYNNLTDESDSGFAWQAIAGVRFPLTDRIDAELKYRFYNHDDIDLVTNRQPNAAFAPVGSASTADWRSHSLLVGLTYNFGEPAAPPPPPVAECTPGPYIVFFEFDKSDITPDAATILDNAVSAYASCGNAQVMLAGHADRAGAPSYNVALSQRRADAAKAYLVSKGISDGVITTQAFGEGKPRVETADGVRELQNRRVEITYGPGSGM